MNAKDQQADENAAGMWPELPFGAWRDTYATLHLWTQVVGKVKLELTPFLNEWWEVPLQLSARGLTTSTIPFTGGAFEIEFDFVDHHLYIRTSDGGTKAMTLMPRSVADFYAEFMAALRELGIEVTLNTLPQQVPHPIPFEQDHEHAAYDRVYVDRWWWILTRVGTAMQRYRSGFVGKSSPVQFYWGDFDLSQSRFSGKLIQPPEGMGRRERFANDQENITSGFWPGGKTFPKPMFYSYMYPAPAGLETASVRPAAARFDTTLNEFAMDYDDVRRGADPVGMIVEFLRSTYESGAALGQWDRTTLEQPGPDVGPGLGTTPSRTSEPASGT